MVHFKPVKTSYYTSYLLVAAALSTILGGAITYYASIMPGVATGSALLTAAWLRRRKQYGIESYEVTDTGLTARRGTRFTSEETTVAWDQVTSVSYHQPLISRLLFGTGSCSVDSAGSTASSIRLHHVEPSTVETINDQVVDCDPRPVSKPNRLAAAGSYGWQALTTVFGLALAFFIPQSTGYNTVTISIIAATLVLNGAAALTRVADTMIKQYDIADDHVLVHGGVFTTEETVLRASHITDTRSNQSFLERLLGVATITVSVAGGERDISLPFIPVEDEFTEQLPERGREPTTATSDDTVSVDGGHEASPQVLRGILSSFLISILLTPVLVAFPLALLLLIAYLGQRFTRLIATTYAVSDDQITSTYSFFQQQSTTYKQDRVTAVSATKNPFDDLFDTVTIEVRSIGSQTPLTIQHVREDSALARALLGDDLGDEHHVTVANASLSTVITRYLPVVLAWLSISGALAARTPGLAVTVFATGALLLGVNAWRLRFAALTYYDDGIELRRGWAWRTTSRIHYEDIKRVTSTQYPLNMSGSVSVYVPGGELRLGLPGFTMPGVPRPWQQHGIVDGCVHASTWSAPLARGEPSWSDEPVLSAATLRSGAWGVFLAGLASIATARGILSPVTALFLVVLGVLVAAVYIGRRAVASYEETDKRFLSFGGILYQYGSTVLVDKVDYTTVSRSWWQTFTKTGTTAMYTAGSEQSDLVFADIPTYDRFRDSQR